MMQTETTQSLNTNIIHGRIVVHESGRGIPDLLVVVWHVDATQSLEELVTACASSPASHGVPPGCGAKIASVLTGQDGSFRVSFADEAFQLRPDPAQRPNLLLMVFAPEHMGNAAPEALIVHAPEIRINAAREEAFFIPVLTEHLAKAGRAVPHEQKGLTQTALDSDNDVPEDPEDPDDPEDDDLENLERQLTQGRTYAESKSTIFNANVETQYQTYASARTADFTSKLKDAISKLPPALRNSPYVVKADESVHQKVFQNIKDQIDASFNNENEEEPSPTSSGFIYLTHEQVQRYEPYLQGDAYVLPAEIVAQEILPKLFGGTPEGGAGNDFIMNHPAAMACVKEIHPDLCAPPAPPETPRLRESPAPAPARAAAQRPAELSDINCYIATQMEHVAAPEDFGAYAIGVGDHGRADADAIAASINKLELKKGPADIPAYFDFHTLKIAFPHVWKEAIDQGIIVNGEALYDKVVAAGIHPTMNHEELMDSIHARVTYFRAKRAVPAPPPTPVIMEFPGAVPVWEHMSENEKTVLKRLATLILAKYGTKSDASKIPLKDNIWYRYVKSGNAMASRPTEIPLMNKEHLIDNNAVEVTAHFKSKGQKIVDQVSERVEEAQQLTSDLTLYDEAAALANALKHNLQQSYSFTYFAATKVEHSVNFGVLLTYRQKWDPVNYQAGELVKTIPLGPKEVRKYSKKTVIKKTRSRKEIEDNLRITKTDTADTSRAESEIVTKAQNKSTFALNTVSTFDIPLGAFKIGNTVTTNSTVDAIKDSNETKKDFREAVRKAAQEYKNERKVEVTSEESFESEQTESGEIVNPNDELTVTYLFYELQRQFKVNERLHRMRPVILVAQEMPAPHDLDDDWILTHDWILKRVLLDDSFQSAFECIMSIRGDRLMLAELEKTLREQRKLVRDLRQNVQFYTDETGRLSRALQAAINKEAAGVEGRDFWDGIPLLGKQLDAVESSIAGAGKIFGFGTEDNPQEANRIRREAAKDTYERAERERRELLGRLERESGVLNGLTHDVADKRRLILEKEVLIARFQNHLKDNILHYMQAIWSYEHADQRFFRLFTTKVPALTADPAQYHIRIKHAPTPAPVFDQLVNVGVADNERKTRHQYTCAPHIPMQNDPVDLEQVADLDNLLGFKGNYMIFPMRHSNVLTDFMMAPYVDSEFQLLDPDTLGNWTVAEFERLYCCLKHTLSDEEFCAIEDELKELYKQILTNPLRPDELITVPTGSLFIEALPGVHPVLEDFKLLHRAVDVKKVQAEVRKLEMENIRYAARLLSEEREDPEIDKKILVEGVQTIVNPDN